MIIKFDFDDGCWIPCRKVLFNKHHSNNTRKKEVHKAANNLFAQILNKEEIVYHTVNNLDEVFIGYEFQRKNSIN